MGLNLEEYAALQTFVEQQQREADKAAGALEQLMPRLKKEFDCDNLKTAQQRRRRLLKEAKKLARRFKEELDKLKENPKIQELSE